MSSEYFPTLRGLAWDVIRTPILSNITQRSASGQTVRIAQFSELNCYFQWTLTHNFLRIGSGEAQELIGFFIARTGSYDSFLYKDPNDFKVITQPIATGDGTTVTFQLKRTYGPSDHFVYEPNTSYQTYVVYLNGTPASGATWSISSGPNGGVLTFTTPPGAGVAIAADFGFDWRVHFVDDQADFSNWIYQVFDCKTLKFVTTRQ